MLKALLLNMVSRPALRLDRPEWQQKKCFHQKVKVPSQCVSWISTTSDGTSRSHTCSSRQRASPRPPLFHDWKLTLLSDEVALVFCLMCERKGVSCANCGAGRPGGGKNELRVPLYCETNEVSECHRPLYHAPPAAEALLTALR